MEFLPDGVLPAEKKVVVGGTYEALQRHLASLPSTAGKTGACFFGDHMWGDVGATRVFTDWEPVAVVEELRPRGACVDGQEPSPGPVVSAQWGGFLQEQSASSYYPFTEGGEKTHHGAFLEKHAPFMVSSVAELAEMSRAAGA